ncbi:Suf-domain-containing protein [Mycena vulgaris]|nr:Suf-domain-containing protein [Mycena vulgaris]
MSETLPDASIKSEPGADPSWKRLVHIADTSGDTALITSTYDALLEMYPHTAAAQIAYVKHFEVDRPNHSKIEGLLSQFLRRSPSADVWKCYVRYIRQSNGPGAREVVRKAFEYSGSIWAEYIDFLKAGPATTAWETGQKMDAIRKVYHRAVQIPIDNIETLWSDYEAFEMELNKLIAKKFMTDLSPAYMQARTVLRQLSTHLGGLGLPTPGSTTLWLPPLPTFSSQERPLIGRWKAYLKWEEGNPLELEEKDRGLLISRVQMVYRQAMIRMRYYPEIWFMAYSWNTSVGRHDEATTILKAGLDANPDSFALTYAYAELLEKAELQKDQRDFKPVHQVYEKFIDVLRAKIIARPPVPAPDPPVEKPTIEVNGSEGPSPPSNQDELPERKKQFANAWINYMRFARRAEGHKAYREVFGKARRDEYTSWEVYEAGALTEYRCNLEDGRTIAPRIFESGMKKFSKDVGFVLSYLGFLLTLNDENNARALFERVIGTFTPQEARPIWERWSRSQYQYDDLEAVLKLEQRMAEVYPNDAPIKRFAQRHTYHSIDPIAEHDLGFAKARKLGGALSKNDTPSFPPTGGNGNGNGNGNNGVNGTGNPTLLTIPNPNKRPPPPPDRKRENDYKRPRPDDRERDRRRPYSPPPPPPSWERERERDVKPPPPPRREPPREKEEKPVTLPPVIDWFIRQLPPASTFDGPVFNTENLMDKLRAATIPSSSTRASGPRAHSPPPPPRSAGRPPPDYGPYQGPGSTPRGTRGRY